MDTTFTPYDFQNRILVSYRSRTVSSAPSCSLTSKDCEVDECLLSCECVPKEQCTRIAIIVGCVGGGILLFILLLGIYLSRTGKLKKMKTRAVNWAKSLRKPKKKLSQEGEPYLEAAQPVPQKMPSMEAAEFGFVNQPANMPYTAGPEFQGDPAFHQTNYNNMPYNPNYVMGQPHQGFANFPSQSMNQNFQQPGYPSGQSD